MRRLAAAILVVTAGLAWLCQPTQAAEVRVALVIGNGAYQNAPQLPNPPNDARDVAAALKRDGFDTILATDLDKNGMEDATIRFARAARAADVALFYYSGHALQFGGVNYLAPIDAKLEDEADLRLMTRVDDIVYDLQQAKNLRILVLNSCRDNPLADQLRRSIGTTRALPLQRGLAKIDTPLGMIVAYATQAGRTAEDGTGRNSPYTAAFLKNIEAPDEIGVVFRRISIDVYQSTGKTQLPELSLSITGEFYLKGKVEIAVKPDNASAPASQTPDPAQQAWIATQSTTSVAVLEDFIRQFGNTVYGSMARARLEELKKSQVATAPATATAPANSSPSVFNSTGGLVREFSSPGVNNIVFSPNGKFMIAGGTDKTLSVWDVNSGALAHELTGNLDDTAGSAAFSPDGQLIAATDDHVIHVWNAASGELIKEFQADTEALHSIAFSPDGRFIVSGGAAHETREHTLAAVRLWDTQSGTLIREFKSEMNPQSSWIVLSVAFSQDGKNIMAVDSDGTVTLWFTPNGALIEEQQTFSRNISRVAISSDQRLIALGDAAGPTVLDFSASDTLPRKLKAPAGFDFRCVAFSSDGRFIVAGDAKGRLALWSVGSGEMVRTLAAHTAAVDAVAFSPDGRFIASGDSQNVVRLWDASFLETQVSDGSSQAKR